MNAFSEYLIPALTWYQKPLTQNPNQVSGISFKYLLLQVSDTHLQVYQQTSQKTMMIFKNSFRNGIGAGGRGKEDPNK